MVLYRIVMSLPMGAFGLYAFSGMADHDRAHTAEIADLLAHIKEGRPFEAHPASAVA